jgi:phosphoribosylformylglycinamidine cyclo-ligase
VTSLNWGELAKVFNLGYRFEVYCAERAVPALIELSASFGVPATVLGETCDSESGNHLELVIQDEHYDFTL